MEDLDIKQLHLAPGRAAGLEIIFVPIRGFDVQGGRGRGETGALLAAMAALIFRESRVQPGLPGLDVVAAPLEGLIAHDGGHGGQGVQATPKSSSAAGEDDTPRERRR